MSGTTLAVGVADAESGAPLAGAFVRISDLSRVARTDWLGEAHIADVPRGTHRVEVRSLGYAPADVQLAFNGDTVGSVFMLHRVATDLDTLRVIGHASLPRLQEFEIHRRMGVGHFLTDSALASDSLRQLALILVARFSGLQLLRATGRFDTPGSYILGSTRGSGLLSNNSVCPVRVILDGLPFRDELESLHAGDIAGVEFYGGTGSAPPQYRRSGLDCGVLVLWSKF